MGSDGLEPSPARVRTECAAANTLIPSCLLSSRSARRESNPRLALIRSLLSPLNYEPSYSLLSLFYCSIAARPRLGPEGIEPSPARLKVCCAALTPRPRNRSEAGVSIVVSSFRISFANVSGPRWSRTTAAAVSERHASVTTPGQNRGGQNRTALSRAPDARGSPLPFTPPKRLET